MKKRFIISIAIIILFFIAISLIIVFSNQKNIEEENKIFCSSESRNADACIEIYQPVCGYPIKETFSNSCFACININVEYYTEGEC